MRAFKRALSLVLLALPAAVFGQQPQVDVAVPMPGRTGASQRFSATIEPGPARVSGLVRNQRDGDTLRVDVRFDYRVPPGTIAFDEIISRIELSTEGGGAAGLVSIDTNEGNLNPNRAALFYRATLYRPPASGEYVARIRVYGNYE